VTAPLRVLIADDHVPTRAGVRLALEGHGFTVCAEAGDARVAVEAARRERPDLCLLDVHMPGSGIAAAAEIAEKVPETAIVMLTVARNDGDLFAALEAGARGYLPKDTDPAALPDALRSAVEGAAPIPAHLVGRLVGEFQRRARRPEATMIRPTPDDLTSREWEVLDALGGGLTTKQIGRRLFISDTTVRRHVGTILRKLGASTRAEAAEMARERSTERSAVLGGD
jgi:DNA-binding NarL/FixJ family response regulator